VTLSRGIYPLVDIQVVHCSVIVDANGGVLVGAIRDILSLVPSPSALLYDGVLVVLDAIDCC
jgi:hypothetical protein